MNDTQDQPAERKAEQIRMCQEVAEMALYLSRLAAQKAAAELTASDAPAENAPDKPRQKRLDPVLALSRLTRIMHEAHAHENRLTAAPKAAARRAGALAGLNIATENQPDRAAIRRQMDTTLDEKLAEDPGHEKAVYDLFMALCEESGIKPDLGKIPDECLGFNIPSPAHADESAAPEFDVNSDEFFSYLQTGHPVPEHILRAQSKLSP